MLRRAVGAAMQAYRASPFHPHMGRLLARGLAPFVGGQRGPIIHAVDGVNFELDLREVIDSSLYFSGTFEPHAERAITGMLRPGMIAIDVGANIGYHTFRMARAVGEQGRVIAVEPSTWAMAKLRRNAALNAFSNIEFLHAGLDEVERGPVATRFQASFRLDGTHDTTEEVVALTTLDQLVAERQLPRLDLVKIDVDGFEGKVLRGAAKTIDDLAPVLFFEIAPSHMARQGERGEDLLAALAARGYRFERDTGEPLSDVIAAYRRIPAESGANLLARPGRA